jgi:hypothetical protein
MADIVLVHGAWAGSWCWELVAPKLRERGHRVETVELHRGTLAADTTAAQKLSTAPLRWSFAGIRTAAW